jgi:hypothetical protein
MRNKEKVVKVKNTLGTNSAAKLVMKWLNISDNLTMKNTTPLQNPMTKAHTVANFIKNN